MTAYYSDESVTLHLGDCREIPDWLTADVLVTDPPYGRAWKQGTIYSHAKNAASAGIANDDTTAARDAALSAWGARPAIAFGDLMLPPPAGTKLVGIYRKPVDAGIRGAIAGLRRDAEAIYLVGPWRAGLGGRSSVFSTTVSLIGGSHGVTARTGHPHTKPLDVMESLLQLCPPGVVADPFAGSGSTLVAAKLMGRKAIGVELEEKYCEIAANRLAQGVLNFEAMA